MNVFKHVDIKYDYICSKTAFNNLAKKCASHTKSARLRLGSKDLSRPVAPHAFYI